VTYLSGRRVTVGPALAVFLVAIGLAACDTRPVRGLMPPQIEGQRSVPADAYPNVNITPSRETRPKTAEEVEETERDLERLRRAHSAGG
jgi:hypothetical protein